MYTEFTLEYCKPSELVQLFYLKSRFPTLIVPSENDIKKQLVILVGENEAYKMIYDGMRIHNS